MNSPETVVVLLVNEFLTFGRQSSSDGANIPGQGQNQHRYQYHLATRTN